jgi:ribose transport system ATP-binding protein
MSAAVWFEGICKSFFGVSAVRDVTLSLESGRLLGLVGQNGAGKSTLMNILGGVLLPDAGTMRVGGEPFAPRGPADARAKGIAFIHQELNLFTNLSIAENLFIHGFPRRAGLIDARAARRRTIELLAEVGLDIPPTAPVGSLSPGERQLVEVAKALEADAQIIIFDEPTTSLTARETAWLFELIGKLKQRGRTIIYITHVLRDVLALADDIAVLRDGKVRAAGPVREFDIDRMISLMLGRDIEQLYPDRQATGTAEVLLDVRKLRTRGIVHDVSLKVHCGEVLGIFGLLGSGRTELARMIFGLDSFEAGEIVIGGRSRQTMTPLDAIQSRLAFVTENRREEGLMMGATISDNIVLAAMGKFAGLGGRLQENRTNVAAGAIASRLGIKASDIYVQPARALSGGNQQKVVLGKWLMAEPSLIILDEPTRGIDIAARSEIYAIRSARRAGMRVVANFLGDRGGDCHERSPAGDEPWRSRL